MDKEIAVAIITTFGSVLAAIITVTLPFLFRQLRRNEQLLKNLIIYKPGDVAYNLLKTIGNKGSAPYNDSEQDTKRCLNHLLDDGYLKPAAGISYVHFEPEYNDRKLHDIVSLSPIAEQLIDYREKNAPKNN